MNDLVRVRTGEVRALERRAVNARAHLARTVRALADRRDLVKGRLKETREKVVRALVAVSCGVAVAILYATVRRRRARSFRYTRAWNESVKHARHT